jgi:hypothetical protein
MIAVDGAGAVIWKQNDECRDHRIFPVKIARLSKDADE